MIYLLVFMSPLLINAQILITELSDGINDQGISIKYIDGAKEPFKGFAFNYYPNGNKELKGSYNRGLKDGKWIWWYPNGEKYKVGYYVKSMEDSIWEWWFSNGQLMKRGKYKNGKKEGRWSEWYENGKLANFPFSYHSLHLPSFLPFLYFPRFINCPFENHHSHILSSIDFT